MLELSAIIAVGVAAYQNSLPDYARTPADDDEPTTTNISGVDEDRQREMCLNCPLPDCVGVDHRRCPINVELHRAWREKNARRRTH